MRFNFLRNYFTVFALLYLLLLATKFVFYFYFEDNYSSYSFSEVVYAILLGYRFDFAASAFIAFIATLFDFNKKAFSTVSALLLVSIFLAQIGDIFYFSEASRHVGYEINDLINDALALFMTAISQHTLGFILALIVAMALFALSYKLFSSLKEERYNRYTILKKLFIIALSIFFIRGMWQDIPLNPWQANQIGDTKLATLSLNASYNMVFSLMTEGNKLRPIDLPTLDKEQRTLAFKELYADNNATLATPLIKTKPNVVLFFLESWSATYLQPYGYTQAEATPNFDAILKKSLHPRFMIANGHRTTEGMFATLTSFQNPLGKSVAQTQLQAFTYKSLIDEFNIQGYWSGFFQGTAKETSGTGSLANSLGFTYSYGKHDISKHIYEKNSWGVHDVDLYNFVLSRLQTRGDKPFVIGINGATTHDDQLPKSVKPIHFVEDETINKLLNTYHFADYALGKFIKEVQMKYPNTVFVLFADHCGAHISGTMQNYQIPFAIYAPQYIKPKYVDTVLSQRDIAPTVADLTLGDYKKIFPNFSGKSLLRDKQFFADYYHLGTLGSIEKNRVSEYNIAAKKLSCFRVDGFSKKATECNSSYEDMNSKLLGLSSVSQKLLFSGEVKEFHNYRYFEK